jgi:nicotinamidase-related amidase
MNHTGVRPVRTPSRSVLRTPFLMLTTPRPWHLVPAQIAVLVIDFDPWATCPKCGALGEAEKRGVGAEFAEYRSMLVVAIENVRIVLSLARDAGCFVAALERPDPTRAEVDPDSQPALCPIRHDDILGNVEVIRRDHLSIFLGTALETELRRRNIAVTILCGTFASRTVRMAAHEAVDRGFSPLVILDACASESVEWQAALASEINGGPMRAIGTDELPHVLGSS